MSHVTAEALHDTSMSPVLFSTGEDRRDGARVPMSRPVRVGPAKGAPEALVSARDLSVGGMFVDADRPVRVGARFSVELDLPDEGPVYVAEAEVAYNREHVHGAGFGVRFLEMHPQARAAIAAEVARQTSALFTDDHESHPLISDLPTLAPTPAEPPAVRPQASIATDQVRQRARTEVPTEVEVEVEAEVEAATAHPEPVDDGPSLPPEPDLYSDLPSPSELPTPAPVSIIEAGPGFMARMQAFLHDAPELIARGAPGVLLLLGLFTIIVVALLSWVDGVSPNQAVAAPRPAAVDSEMYEYMQGKAPAPDVTAPAEAEAAAQRPVKRRLPPAVSLEQLAPAPIEAPAKAAAPKVDKAEVETAPTAQAPKAKKAAAPKVDKAQASKADKAAPRRLSPAARALLGDSSTLHIPLEAGATVRKSYVLHAPERFVVDVVGQDGPLSVPAANGVVQGVRTGRHPGFVRIVVDVQGTLDSAKAQRTGTGLDLQLRLR